jgi:hypothetical protein
MLSALQMSFSTEWDDVRNTYFEGSKVFKKFKILVVVQFTLVTISVAEMLTLLEFQKIEFWH